jgi:uncharacterized protein with GYD domain
MPVFVMLSTIGPDGFHKLNTQPERLREVNEEVEALGVKVLHQWALLGQYDFINIIEAPDDVTVAKLATKLAARGTMKTTTIKAIDVDDYIAALARDPDPL